MDRERKETEPRTGSWRRKRRRKIKWTETGTAAGVIKGQGHSLKMGNEDRETGQGHGYGKHKDRYKEG